MAVEDETAPIPIHGVRTTGDPYTGLIYLPSTYSLLMMKLFALRDQVNEETKEFGRKHALDVYTLVAILTEPEYLQTQAISMRYCGTEEAREAARIVTSLFGTEHAIGILRVRENNTLPANADIQEFLTLLGEFFPLP